VVMYLFWCLHLHVARKVLFVYLFWCLHLHVARKVCGHVFVCSGVSIWPLFYEFDILFWNCSDSVVYFVPTEFHLLIQENNLSVKIYLCYLLCSKQDFLIHIQ
jgi:hypothetical protein